ncbi:hypothetical protein ACLMJK_004799 [Lecanora helva]
MILFPRFHLAEIEDQSWCPSWLRESSHSSLAQMWKTQSSKKGSPAEQACDIIFENIDDVSNFTFIDACAGAGGPTPLMEARLNQVLKAQGKAPAPFILTDLYPDLNAWKSIVKKSENISYFEKPIDATKAQRLAAPNRKEARTYNLCFHHFDDPAAKKVLRSAVEEADAFFIFEMTQRNFMALMNTSIVILSPLITTLIFFWNSPIHLIFTYLIPLVPLFYAVDGYVSCIRTRTPEETTALLKGQPDLDLSEWEFRSGERMVLPPFGNIYWYAGVKKGKRA